MRRLTRNFTTENFPGSGYTPAEAEFMKAMDRYKRERDRPVPTWPEVLAVLKSLEYRKIPA
jgi:hypothetical protein